MPFGLVLSQLTVTGIVEAGRSPLCRSSRFCTALQCETVSSKLCVVVKSKLPSISLRPWKFVDCEIRLMASKDAVDLQLVSRDLIRAHGRAVGRLGDQGADIVHQRT